jgi:hypothetical protein
VIDIEQYFLPEPPRYRYNEQESQIIEFPYHDMTASCRTHNDAKSHRKVTHYQYQTNHLLRPRKREKGCWCSDHVQGLTSDAGSDHEVVDTMYVWCVCDSEHTRQHRGRLQLEIEKLVYLMRNCDGRALAFPVSIGGSSSTGAQQSDPYQQRLKCHCNRASAPLLRAGSPTLTHLILIPVD